MALTLLVSAPVLAEEKAAADKSSDAKGTAGKGHSYMGRITQIDAKSRELTLEDTKGSGGTGTSGTGTSGTGGTSGTSGRGAADKSSSGTGGTGTSGTAAADKGSSAHSHRFHVA